MRRPYRDREKLRRLLRDGEESKSDCVDEQLRDIAWNLKEKRSHMMCRYCGEYIPDALPDDMGVCAACFEMMVDDAEDKLGL